MVFDLEMAEGRITQFGAVCMYLSHLQVQSITLHIDMLLRMLV